ncbi:ornithine carbamoyltransferase [Bradyrhizobium liaoningense]|nr:ornithine carbamoyltransferase [Bradyrhizobium liaoningense]
MDHEPARDFLEFHDLGADTILSIIDRAQVLAAAWSDRAMPQCLAGKRAALIADDGGWRNTTAFELGVKAMGGICVSAPVRFNTGEATADLANWFDVLIVRTRELSALRELASHTDAPVVNARTRSNHPCETLGDLAYVRSRRASLDGLKVVGVAPAANILRSWVEASVALPLRVTQIYPEDWHITDIAAPNFTATTCLDALFDADVIVTDCWPDGARADQLLEYQVSASLLDRCRPDVIFLPCPPVTRGQEVSLDAMSDRACQSPAAKTYLLHAQNALLEWIAASRGFGDNGRLYALAVRGYDRQGGGHQNGNPDADRFANRRDDLAHRPWRRSQRAGAMPRIDPPSRRSDRGLKARDAGADIEPLRRLRSCFARMACRSRLRKRPSGRVRDFRRFAE